MMLKKSLISFFLLLFVAVPTWSQQTNFLPINEIDTVAVPPVPQSLTVIFKHPERAKAITLFADDLDSLPLFDCAQLTNLRTIHIQFAYPPDSSYAEREDFFYYIADMMKFLNRFASCPQLKRIVFGVGEHLYLTKEEQIPTEVDYRYEINLDRAWKSFGKQANTDLPNIRLYAYNWVW
ncbi:MAG: hypothetical protein ACRCYO_10040 [Bacteroidia bacterium]